MCYGCNLCNRCGKVDQMRSDNAVRRCPRCKTVLASEEAHCPSCGLVVPPVLSKPGESAKGATAVENAAQTRG